MNETYGKMVNDDQVAALQNIIDLFIAESENVNKTLEGQKRAFKDLKKQNRLIHSQRKEIKDEIQNQMRENKELQITTNKIERKNDALR